MLGRNQGSNNPMYGRKHSLETINKIRKKALGRKHSIQSREKMSISRKGKLRSEEIKRKISQTKTGVKRKPFSKEWRRKLSLAGKGRIFSDETRKKLSIIKKGYKHKEESIQKIRIAHLGKKLTKGTKQKISLANRTVNNANWKGGKNTFFRNRARQVMEQHLERKLASIEVIHHKDCNIRNNKISNLYLTNRSQHTRIHHVINRFKKAECQCLILKEVLGL